MRLTVLVLIASTVLAVPGTAPAVAASNPGSACETFQLTLAPALSSDRTPAGEPVAISPDARGKYTPIVMIHGWTGTDVHTKARKGNFSHKIDLTALKGQTADVPRSLIGQLQSLRGAAVFTFDYHEWSARWVDDEHIGPALGGAIDCLYSATGERVILVGHSMGGLAARWALGQGAGRASKVSSVVTFGTPNEGSLMALLTDAGLNGAAAAGLVARNAILPLLRAFLAECGAKSSDTLDTGGICQILPPPARAFDSDAGKALRYGSAQLAALAAWPSQVNVDALAGQAIFQVPKSGWFQRAWDTDDVPMGDLIVDEHSSRAKADTGRKVECRYQLNAVQGVANEIAFKLGQISESSVPSQPLKSFAGACFHTNLMRTIQLANEALGFIADDLASRIRPGVSKKELLTLKVPPHSGCAYASDEFDAGVTLSGGKTESSTGGFIDTASTVLADVDRDGVGDGLANLVCSSGAGGTSNILVEVRGSDRKVFEVPFSADAERVLKGLSVYRIYEMSASAGILSLITSGHTSDDATCCPSETARVRYEFDPLGLRFKDATLGSASSIGSLHSEHLDRRDQR